MQLGLACFFLTLLNGYFGSSLVAAIATINGYTSVFGQFSWAIKSNHFSFAAHLYFFFFLTHSDSKSLGFFIKAYNFTVDSFRRTTCEDGTCKEKRYN